MDMKFTEIMMVGILLALIMSGFITGMMEVVPLVLFAFAATIFTYKLTQKWMENRIELMIDTNDTTPHVCEERGKLMHKLLRFYDLQDKYDINYNDDGTFSYLRKNE